MQGNRRARGAVNIKQLRTIDKGVLKRLLAYLKHYKKQAAVVLAGIIISSASGVASSLFLGMLIDRYIMPMIGQAAPDYSGLAETIANAIAALGEREEGEPVIRVYLDGSQLSDAVTKYQRREQRMLGA